jgi:hypothetical protein
MDGSRTDRIPSQGSVFDACVFALAFFVYRIIFIRWPSSFSSFSCFSSLFSPFRQSFAFNRSFHVFKSETDLTDSTDTATTLGIVQDSVITVHAPPESSSAANNSDDEASEAQDEH